MGASEIARTPRAPKALHWPGSEAPTMIRRGGAQSFSTGRGSRAALCSGARGASLRADDPDQRHPPRPRGRARHSGGRPNRDARLNAVRGPAQGDGTRIAYSEGSHLATRSEPVICRSSVGQRGDWPELTDATPRVGMKPHKRNHRIVLASESRSVPFRSLLMRSEGL
jgi:hypothetical protein